MKMSLYTYAQKMIRFNYFRVYLLSMNLKRKNFKKARNINVAKIMIKPFLKHKIMSRNLKI